MANTKLLPEEGESVVDLSQSLSSKEPLDDLKSADETKEEKKDPVVEHPDESSEVPKPPKNPDSVEPPPMLHKHKDTTIKNAHKVILEGVSSVTIVRCDSDSDSNVSWDSSEDEDHSVIGDERKPRPGEKEKEDADVDSKIRFTIDVQDRHENRFPRYQGNKPSDIVDLSRKVTNLDSKAPVIEQMITFGFRKHNTPLSEMHEDDIISVDLVIHSPLLINAFRAVVQYYSGESLSGSQVKIAHPYPFAFHHREQLKLYKGSPRPEHTQEYNEECDKHIDVFLEYLEKHTGLSMDEEEARWARKVPVATFQNLWYLLLPGEDVYAVDESGTPNAFVVKSVEGSGFASRSTIPTPYSVKLWRMDFNGSWIGRSTKIFTIRPFEGESEITNLDVYPARFHKDPPGSVPLRDQLIARGKKFFAMTKGPAYREYNGFTSSTPRRKYNRARIMVDNRYEPWSIVPKGWVHAPNLASRAPTMSGAGDPNNPQSMPPRPPPPPGYNPRIQRSDVDSPFVPGCRCPKCEETNEQTFSIPKVKFHDYDYIHPREIETLTDHQLFLCPPQIFGYVLKDRHWHLLDVDKIELPSINEKAIDYLVMSEESDKNMIKAICQQYSSRGGADDENFAPDIIDGKGEGQIFLLHGPPGTGKTLTAECVAEFTHRPLISITAGDLGSVPATLEKNLDEFFRQGTDWDAIVLLDEADVYLEARQPHDLERNSIVSVFLRSLEYYQGILFITTNRIGTFDEAFASRIHVQLHYKALDEKARASIWDNNFMKLKDEGHRGGQRVDVDRDAKDYIRRGQDVKELSWNGREIRNAFQTAIALAVYETKEGETPLLKEEHLTKVVRMSAAFKKYVKDMFKMTLEERAQAYQIRATDVPPPERSLGAGFR